MASMVDEFFRQTIQYYNTNAAKYAAAVEKQSPLPEVGKFLQCVQKDGNILDIGCGSGRDSRIFTNLGFQVTGIDIAEGILDEARWRSPNISFKKMDMRKLNFNNETFDGIWVSSSIGELPTLSDVKKTLNECFRVLKPGGCLHIRVKAPLDPQKKTDVVKEVLTENNPRFLRYFTKSELTKLVKQSGFTVSESYTYKHEQRHTDYRNLVWVVVFATKPTK